MIELFNKYNTIVDSIQGWYYYQEINPVLYKIHNFHQQINLIGDICEIGIYQGKFFLALCCLKQDSEICLAIDSFGTSRDTDWMYGIGEENKKLFQQNHQKLFDNANNYILIQKQSSQISCEEIRQYSENKVRFFSIDGDHTFDGAYYDLELSRCVLSDYGIIIVDDYTNSSWPEVKHAVDTFLDKHQDMSILKIYSNKIFLCFKNNLTLLNNIISV